MDYLPELPSLALNQWIAYAVTVVVAFFFGILRGKRGNASAPLRSIAQSLKVMAKNDHMEGLKHAAVKLAANNERLAGINEQLEGINRALKK